MYAKYHNPLEDLSFDAVIPSALLLACIQKQIEPICITFYGILRGLARVKGYCWAENSYLAKVMECDESSIDRWLESLEKIGSIKRKTKRTGILWNRRIYIDCELKKCLRSLKIKASKPQKKGFVPVSSPYIYYKGYVYNNNTSAAADFASYFLSKIKEKKPDLTKKEIPKSWIKDCDKLLKLRDIEKLKIIVEYVISGWWLKNILCPAKLIEHLDRLEIEMIEARNPMQKSGQYGKVISQDILDNRKQWASKNTWYSAGGSAYCDEIGYHITTHSGKQQTYYYNKDEQFWKERGL